MDPSLVALGAALIAASLLPLLAGRTARAGALAYLGVVAWGLGFGFHTGMLLATGAVAAATAAGVSLAASYLRGALSPGHHQHR